MIVQPFTRCSFITTAATLGIALGVAAVPRPLPRTGGEGKDLADDAEQDLADFRAFLAHQRLWYGDGYATWVADSLIEIAKAHAAAGTFDTEAATRELERRFIAQPFAFHDRAHAHLLTAIERHGEPAWLKGRTLRAWPPETWPPEEWAR